MRYGRNANSWSNLAYQLLTGLLIWTAYGHRLRKIKALHLYRDGGDSGEGFDKTDTWDLFNLELKHVAYLLVHGALVAAVVLACRVKDALGKGPLCQISFLFSRRVSCSIHSHNLDDIHDEAVQFFLACVWGKLTELPLVLHREVKQDDR